MAQGEIKGQSSTILNLCNVHGSLTSGAIIEKYQKQLFMVEKRGP